MIQEYTAMWPFGLTGLGGIGVLLLIFLLLKFLCGPSALTFLGGWLLFLSSGWLLYLLLSPLIVRVILPSTIMILEQARILLNMIQLLIDLVAIEVMIKSDFYPLREDAKHYACILGGENLTSDDLWKCYRKLLAKYDPENFKHLGTEFQVLAERRRKEVCEAKRVLVREGRIIE